MSEQQPTDGPVLLRHLLERERQILEQLGLALGSPEERQNMQKSRHHLVGYVLATAQLLMLTSSATEELLAAYGQPTLNKLRQRDNRLLDRLLAHWYGADAETSAPTTVDLSPEDQTLLPELVCRALMRLNVTPAFSDRQSFTFLQQNARLPALLSAFSTAEQVAQQTKHSLSLRRTAYCIALATDAGQRYQEGGEGIVDALALFDQERLNLDAARTWLHEQTNIAPDSELDTLLILDADATAFTGNLRYTQYNERIPQLEQALAAARRQNNREAQNALLANLGIAYRTAGEFRRAIAVSEQQLTLAREIGDHPSESAALDNLGVAYRILGEARRAIGFHNQGLAIARETDDHLGEATALLNLSNAHSVLGEYRRAITYCEQSLAISRALGNHLDESKALGNLGNAYLALGEPYRAITYYEQELAISRTLGNRLAEGNALGNLGNSYLELKEPHQALAYHQQHLSITRALGDRLAEGNALGNLGTVYLHLGELQRAHDFFEQCLTIARAIGNRVGESRALGNLGTVFMDLGEIEHALSLYEQSLAIARTIGNREREASALINLGHAYLTQTEPHRAITFYKQHLAIARELDDVQGIADSGWNIGLCFLLLKDPTQALVHLEQSLALFQQIGHPNITTLTETITYIREHGTLPNVQPMLELPDDLPPAVRSALERLDEIALNTALAALPPDEEQEVVMRLQEHGISLGSETVLARIMREFAPLLQAICVIAQGDETQRAEVETALAELEQDGWMLSEPAQRIWAGERDAEALTLGLDAHDTALVQHILSLLEDSEATFEVATHQQQPDLNEVVRHYLPILGDIALAAHGDADARALAEAALPLMEQNGWRIAEAAQRIWDGERDTDKLTADIDVASAALVRRALELVADGPAMIFAAYSLQIAHLRRQADEFTAQALRDGDPAARAALAQQLAEAAQQAEGQPGAPWQALAAHLRGLAGQLVNG